MNKVQNVRSDDEWPNGQVDPQLAPNPGRVPVVRDAQPSLRETSSLRELLARLDLTGRVVVDLGVAHPSITGLILERRPSRLIECDGSLECEEAEVLTRDLSSLDLLPENCVVFANPPTKNVGDVLEVLDASRVRDVVLMVEDSCAFDLIARGFEIVVRLNGDAFDPPVARSYVVATRWETPSKSEAPVWMQPRNSVWG